MIVIGGKTYAIRKAVRVVFFYGCLALVIAGLFVSFRLAPASLKHTASLMDSEVSAADTFLPSHVPARNWDVPNVQLSAGSAVLMEVGIGSPKALFIKNETDKMPVASLTKLMTALVVLSHYNLNQYVTVSPAAMKQEGEQGVLQAGQVLTVKDLLYIALIESSNRAAYALSEVMGSDDFVREMNAEAQQLGLRDTRFVDSTGLDARSYSTAQDIATLSTYLFEHYPLFVQIVGTQKYDLHSPNGRLHHQLVTTNKLLADSPDMLGGKTGWTTEAKGCFMALFKSPAGGSYLLGVVLGSDNRFDDMQHIINWAHEAYTWK